MSNTLHSKPGMKLGAHYRHLPTKYVHPIHAVTRSCSSNFYTGAAFVSTIDFSSPLPPPTIIS